MVVRGLEEIVEEVVLGELRKAGEVVVVGEAGGVLLPVQGALFLKVAHQQVSNINKIEVLPNLSMESPPSFSEQQMITHIKFIARSLVEPPAPVPSPPRPVRTFDSYPQSQQQPCYHQVKLRMKGDFWSDEKKRKRKPIFSKVEPFWPQSSPSDRLQHTPLMERISKNVYDRFKTETQEVMKMSRGSRKTPEQSEQIWNQFLQRENEWIQDRKDVYQEMKLLEQARFSSQSPPRPSLKSREPSPNLFKEQELSPVQLSIKQLKQKTERLRSQLQQKRQEELKKEGRIKTLGGGQRGRAGDR